MGRRPVNLGLRSELSLSRTERHISHAVDFDPNVASPLQRLVFPTCVAACSLATHDHRTVTGAEGRQ